MSCKAGFRLPTHLPKERLVCADRFPPGELRLYPEWWALGPGSRVHSPDQELLGFPFSGAPRSGTGVPVFHVKQEGLHRRFPGLCWSIVPRKRRLPLIVFQSRLVVERARLLDTLFDIQTVSGMGEKRKRRGTFFQYGIFLLCHKARGAE